MNMYMFGLMGVFMLVYALVIMKMPVFMRFVSDCPSHAPYQIDQPKGGKEPRNDAATHPFDKFKFSDRYSHGYSNKPQDYGTANMTNTAKGGKQNRFLQRPFSGF